MKIFILEDEPVQQFHLENLIESSLKENKYPNEGVFACGRPKDLLEVLEDYPQNNLYFLDIAINNRRNAGLETAEKIRKIDPLGQISFVTTHSEFAPITYEYKVNTYDFIDKILPKGMFERRIFDNIDHYFEMHRIKPLAHIFSYQTRTGKEIEALYSDIFYFETTGTPHKIILQMEGETLTFYGTLEDIEGISDKLIRIHRSYLVNKDRIKRYLKKEKLVILDDDTDLPVSRNGARILGRL